MKIMFLFAKASILNKIVTLLVFLVLLTSGYFFFGEFFSDKAAEEQEAAHPETEIAGDDREEADAEELAARVICSQAVIGDIEVRSSFNIMMEASREYSVHPRISGEIERVNVKVGDSVSRGEVLAEIDDRRYRAELDQARAGLAAAEAELSRLEVGTPPEQLEQIKARMDEAQASVAGARRNVGFVGEIFAERTPDDMEIERINTEFEQAIRQLEIAEKEKEQAELAHEDAVDNYERMASLYARGGISERTYEEVSRGKKQTRIALEAAEAGVSQAESVLKGTEVLKEMTGDLYEFRAEEEQMVSQARTQYEAAEAALKGAKAALAEAERGPTREEIEAARARTEEARARAELASTIYDDIEIKAPADGIIAQVEIEEGELAGPEMSVFYLVNLDMMQAAANINETHISKIAVGDKAPVTVFGLPAEEFTGLISTISPLAAEGGGFPVELQVPNPDLNIKSGMRGSIELVVDRSENTLLISQDATFTPAAASRPGASSGNERAVFVIDDEKRARYQLVRTGLETRDKVEILSGLDEGDRLILYDQGRIEDGQKVEVVENEAI